MNGSAGASDPDVVQNMATEGDNMASGSTQPQQTSAAASSHLAFQAKRSAHASFRNGEPTPQQPLALRKGDAATQPEAGFAVPQGLLARRRMTVLVHAPRQSGIVVLDGLKSFGRVDGAGLLPIPASPASTTTHGATASALPHAPSMAPGRAAGSVMRLPAAVGAATAGADAAQATPAAPTPMAHVKSFASRRFDGRAGADAAPAHHVLLDLPAWKAAILRGMNHTAYYVFLCLTTAYIVFEDDFKRAVLPPSTDLALETILTVILFCILMEMGLSCAVKSGYALGFYFWIDCIVCVSLAFEIPTVKSTMLGISSGPASLDKRDSKFFWASDRAFIASKVLRVARIFRLLRLLRLYAVVRRMAVRRRIRAALAKAGIHTGLGGDQSIAEEQMSLIELEILHDQDRETRVGQKLEELIARRIILFILVCVLLLPAFEAEFGLWGRRPGVDKGGLLMLHEMAMQIGNTSAGTPATNGFSAALQAFVPAVLYRIGTRYSSQVLELTVRNNTYMAYPPGLDRRQDELFTMQYISPDPTRPRCAVPNPPGLACPVWVTYALYDWKWYSQVAAVLSIGRSVFVILFLALGAWLLNRDCRALVLEPIERMVARVTALADDPLALQPEARAPWQEQADAVANAQAAEAAHQALVGAGNLRASARGSAGNSKLSVSLQPSTLVRSSGLAWDSQQEDQGRAEQMNAQVLELPAPPAPRVLDVVRSGVGRAIRFSRPHLRAAAAAWRRFTAATQRLLQRVAANFWDAIDEDAHDREAVPGAPGKDATYETQLLENSIQKIGALLAVGFGDAGAEIIAENIRREGDINPMVPGRKTIAVFGFCDIRRFTDATEVLQEEVMEFVNSVARIVHTSVAVHGGAANKNIGDAFLLVWKLPKGFTMQDLQEACAAQAAVAPAEGEQRSTSPSNGAVSGTPQPPLPLPQHPPGHTDRLSLRSCSDGDRDSIEKMIRSMAIAEGTETGGSGPFARNAAPSATELLTLMPFLTPAPGTAELDTASNDNPHGSDRSAPVPGYWNGTDGSASGMLELPSLAVPSGASPMGLATLLPAQQQAAVSSKPRFMSIPDARVVPLVSDNTLGATRAKRALTNQATTNASGRGAAGDARGGGDDLEAEAVRRMMRMKSKGGSPGPGQEAGPSTKTALEKAALVAAVADNALAAFTTVHAALRRSVRLARYAARADLAARLGPQPRVHMGFGLHVGWAIEGAVGSEYKIDATYLSPNVNMASRLEAATKQFGVTLLMSDAFAACLSPEMRARVRQIDCVTVKGSTQPVGLFTYDIDLSGVQDPDPDAPGAEEEEEEFWAGYASGSCDVDDLGGAWGASWEFLAKFNGGFQAYREGDWQAARHLLSEARDMRTDVSGARVADQPSQVLLEFMNQHGYVAPPGWRGFRELTEK